jgi:hypothetical protein
MRFIVSLLKVTSGHSLEADFGDYIEGITHSSPANQFELTLSDEIGLKKCFKDCGGVTYRWTTIQELDLTTSSPDTPTEVYPQSAANAGSRYLPFLLRGFRGPFFGPFLPLWFGRRCGLVIFP